MYALSNGYNPTFPSTIIVPATFAHLTSAAYVTHVRSYLKTLKAAHRKHVNWLTRCDAYSNGTGEAPKLSSMPSKPQKHRMYGASGHMNALCGWDRTKARCGSLQDIANQIAAVESALNKL